MPDDSILNSIDPKDIIAVMGKGSQFEGKLTFEGAVQIDGKFNGEIFSKGALIIGENAKVKAEISVSSVVLKGELTGNIKAPNCIELHAPARFVGNMVTPCLYVQKGVVFEGNTIMESDGGTRGRSGSPPPVPAD